MKYIANPVEVEAFEIVQVTFEAGRPMQCRLSDGSTREASREMTARLIPGPGDYWVIQADGYIYLNPKDVFERKYRPAEGQEAQSAS